MLKHGELKHGELKHGWLKHGELKHGELKHGDGVIYRQDSPKYAITNRIPLALQFGFILCIFYPGADERYHCKSHQIKD